MTMHPAGINQGLPLEREHEGWLTERMHEYFEQLGVDAQIWAVSPADESTWPADENVWVGRKWFSLQFKRPYRHQNQEAMSAIHWRMEQAQFDLIKNYPHIYYLLPTTTNRNWRKVSLHHCLLWRPQGKDQAATAWYDRTGWHDQFGHPNAFGFPERLERYCCTYRWGAFMERLFSCEFGHKVEDGSDSEVQGAIRAWLDANMNAREATALFNIGVKLA